MRRRTFPRLLLFALVFAAAACSRPLPEADSPDAKLYAYHCGRCHVAYHPGLLTPAMWDAMVERMEGDMRRAGMPLPPRDKAAILAYLHRNAGGR